ncbi:MAG: class I SAM-dependent methyltransferase [Sandaracinaceae bacterium]
MRLVLFTTRYRKGGTSFARAARTLGDTLREAPGALVRVERVESKADARGVFQDMAQRGHRITQLHVVAHAGMYGPMFGSTRWPEQFSPHEWRELSVPFADDAEAHFHTCRSARWFAPFFARTFGVPAYGNHWYTAFSTDPTKFVWPRPWLDRHRPLYVIGCPGRKSHGLAGSLAKYTGRQPAEKMRRFPPERDHARVGYEAVATAYDGVFEDISVREDEVRWLESRLAGLPPRPRVLDIGCGNGALLARLAPTLESGVGVDASSAMVSHARRRASAENLSIHHVTGPTIPLPDASVDVAISMLSFRYLDWDPLVRELGRVLTPDGRLLIVDMVEKPAPPSLWPRAALDRLRVLAEAKRRPGFQSKLSAMVASPEWAEVLVHNPMRALHEYEWYLGSRFPEGEFDVLNVGRRARVIAFDTGAFSRAHLTPQAYP